MLRVILSLTAFAYLLFNHPRELKTVTIWFQNKRQTVKKEQAAIAAAAAMQRGGTPEGSSDSDYFESPHSSHPSSAHSSSHSSTPYSSQPSVYHNVLSVEESPIHGRHLAYSTRRASFTNTHDFSRPHHHPYQRSPSSRSVYSTRPGGSSLPSTMASPVGPSFTLDQACALQSSSQSYPHTEEDELDDDIEIMDGPPDLSPTHVTNFSDRNYTWKIEGENGDMDVGPSGDSADEMEVVTPSASMHSIPCILNNSPPRQVSKYSEEMVDAAIVLCRLGRDQC
ncbi:hypothetical protein FRC02_000475 [Tulasnella sp. 418]|nr:hypothetical protein FRC02_000475 [Tulasnella sp. 418]